MQVDVLRSDCGCIDKFHRQYAPDPLDINDQVSELWTAKLTEAAARKGNPMYIPVRVVNDCLLIMPKRVLVKLPSGDFKYWGLIGSPGRNYEYHIGEGWYEFKDETHLKPGDRVRFSRRGYQHYMIVEVV